MSHHRLPPPHIANCLELQVERKGGTVIAENVTTLEAHRALICQPDGYRLAACPRCHGDTLHVHDYRTRILVAFEGSERGADAPIIHVARYACARSECGAIWQVLPAFVARHLWRAWSTVEEATVEGEAVEEAPPVEVPLRTRERWASRLLSSALLLVQLFATETGSELEALAKQLGLEATRYDLVAAYAAAVDVASGSRLSRLAAITNRLSRRVRLM